jgi:TolB-like protein
MALYIVGFDDLVTSFVATIATGWSDPCRVGLSPTGKPRLYAAHKKRGLVSPRRGGGTVRAAIGDSGREQRLIRTLSGKGFRFVGDVQEERSCTTIAKAAGQYQSLAWMLAERPCVAVLPFAHPGGRSRQASLADGLTEDLITALAKADWFRVVSRSSSFAHKGRVVETRQVAHKLRARYLLEGSVRPIVGDRLRISAQLVDGFAGHNLWADRYDTSVADVATVQDDIVDKVVIAVEPQLYLAERLRTEGKSPETLNAWECMVRALALINSRGRAQVEDARSLMHRTIVLNPGSARAFSLLSFITTLQVHQGWEERRVKIPLALDLAHDALALNCEHAWAHLALGYAHIWLHPEDAVAHLGKALALDQNLAVAHYLIALAYTYAGKGHLALDHAHQFEQLSSRDLLARGNTGAQHNVRSTAGFAMGHYRDGIGSARKAMIESPMMPTAYRAFVMNCALAGEKDEACAALQRLMRLAPSLSQRWIRETAVWSRPEDQQKYLEAFCMVGLRK